MTFLILKLENLNIKLQLALQNKEKQFSSTKDALKFYSDGDTWVMAEGIITSHVLWKRFYVKKEQIEAGWNSRDLYDVFIKMSLHTKFQFLIGQNITTLTHFASVQTEVEVTFGQAQNFLYKYKNSRNNGLKYFNLGKI